MSVSMTLRAVPAGTLVPGRWIGQGVEARQRTVPGPPGWGLSDGPITHPFKKKWITETLNTRRQPSLGANTVPCLDRQRMTPLSQSREDAQELNKPLVREKTGWKNWSEVQIAAAGRDDWRDCVEALCATWHEEDR